MLFEYCDTGGDALGEDTYYDIQHLNVAGAEAFTNRMMDRIGDAFMRRE
jgi:hypothetical protein